MSADEAKKCWGNRGKYPNSKWIQHISKIEYIYTFLTANEVCCVDFDSMDVYPIRTFNLLIYDNNCLYLKEAEHLFNEVETSILEMCNGKNTILDISNKLNYSNYFVQEYLKEFKERMYVYSVKI